MNANKVKEIEKEKPKKIQNESYIAKIMNEQIIDINLREQLVNAESNEEFEEILTNANPNNNYDSFKKNYLAWANNPTKDLSQTTYISRFRNLLGSFVYGSPESMNMPFYFYYTNQDKVRSAPFHFNIGRFNYKMQEKYINEQGEVKNNPFYFIVENVEFTAYRLFVNRYTRYFRQKMARQIAIILLAVGLLSGVILKPAVVGVQNKIHKMSIVSEYKKNSAHEIDYLKSEAEKQKTKYVEAAKELKTQYESGKIQADEFNKRITNIKDLDTKLDKNLQERIDTINSDLTHNIDNLK